MSELPGDAELRRRAEAWRDEDPDPETRAEIGALLDAGDARELAERFGGRLQFGTAGLRGALGAGPNRMNRALVRRATAGIASWVVAHGGRRAVVGRDARHGSAAFAEDAASVLSGAGIDTLVVPRPVPTPVLAFAVRHLGSDAGLMITASHNPAPDNGCKLYLGDGAQIVPPVDAEISAAIDRVGPLPEVPLDDRRVRVADDDVVEAYLDAVAGLVDRDGPRGIQAVHTALHGVGTEMVRAAFERARFPVPSAVPEQAEPDPDFPTVAFPNPEEPGALDLAIAHAERTGAELVLASDPDADRLAVAVPDPSEGGWRALSGDELGVLLADHLLRRDARPGDVVATTVVSSRLLARIAASAGIGYVETLTGFKWIARAAAPGQRFRFGYEEALGYCVGEVVRDKDGISAALVVAELGASLRAEGRTLLDRLEELWRRHGVHATGQRAVRIAGVGWQDRVDAAMAALRGDPPTRIAGRQVREVEDLLEARRLPPADALVLTVDGARLVVRPSGTEPKLKCYAEAVVPVEGDDVAGARVRASRTVEGVLDGLLQALAL